MTFSDLMTFRELKRNIDEAQNKVDLPIPFKFYLKKDGISIISILYNYGIPCNNLSSVSDIYNVVKIYQLDKELFKKPYYLIVELVSFDENTINIINQLSDDVFVDIVIGTHFDCEKMSLLSKISHSRCQFSCGCWMDLDSANLLINKFTFYEHSNPIIVIKKIDSTTIDKVLNVCQRIKNSQFRIEIGDAESLKELYNVVQYIPDQEVFVELSDDLFDERNPNNARNAIFQKTKGESHINKKLDIRFRKIKYNSMEQIYDLERNIGLVKSHIPSHASKLDIITYVTLFMINYFEYDYDMYAEIKKNPILKILISLNLYQEVKECVDILQVLQNTYLIR